MFKWYIFSELLIIINILHQVAIWVIKNNAKINIIINEKILIVIIIYDTLINDN